MIRYQSDSPSRDCIPTAKFPTEDQQNSHHHSLPPNLTTAIEPKPLRTIKPRTTLDPSITTVQDHTFPPRFPLSSSPDTIPTTSSSGGVGDVLLQWGQKKRSRKARTENRTSGDSGGYLHRSKIQRRSICGLDKDKSVVMAVTATVVMPPPPPNCRYTRVATLRPSIPVIRNVEDQSYGPCRLENRSSLQKMHRTVEVANGSSSAQPESTNPSSNPSSEHCGATAPVTTASEKLNHVVLDCPRIYVSLSRKEKEEDFYAMRGTKLPHRPKKRAKNIDKAIQYCFPGLWLSDLTRGRYEVREKKCVKKQKRRGLKVLEVDSDSDQNHNSKSED